MKTSGPADFKSTPDFENQERFVGVIEQNKILNSFDKYCTNMYTSEKFMIRLTLYPLVPKNFLWVIRAQKLGK